MEQGKKVMVGMSGGVDSSVAALLLKQQGYQVVGVTMRMWGQQDMGCDVESGCCSVDDVNDARMVCHTLDIPHYVFNYRELFRETVVEDFVSSYLRGETPNPCIVCNRQVKIAGFVRQAEAMGFDYVATGHYACTAFDPDRSRWRLRRGANHRKDQSYVLYCLTQQQLSHILFPLGGYAKEEVRAIAAENGLVVSGKADSQDICFVPDGDYAGFLARYTGTQPQPGDFVDPDGNRLGRHRGIWHYTIGQRKGLGVSFGKPMFVTAIDPAANTVTLAEDKALWKTELLAGTVNWIDFPVLEEPMRLQAKIRYAHTPQPATVYPEGDGVRVVFDEPQRAITKGQAVVFYDGDYVAGGATIR